MQHGNSNNPGRSPLSNPGAAAGVPADQIPARWRKHHAALLKIQDDLLQRQGDLTRQAIETSPLGKLQIADAATDAHDRDLTLGTLSSERELIYQIEQAFERMRNGTYGICELTGKRIEPERLEAIPWTRYSAAATRELEQQAAANAIPPDAGSTASPADPPR